MNERAIFDAALDIADRADRAAYLEHACAGDADLRRNVEGLIDAQSRLGDFLASPPFGVGPRVRPGVCEGPGDRLGPYKLVQQIGEGGMGLVFMAEQSQPVRRLVALKVLKPGLDTRHVLARFDAERQALALMDHPHIAKVFDAGTTPAGRPYFVMELVRGVPITDFCDQHRFDPRRRLALFADVCRAVQHAHTKGIIHRDLKPSNVLVTLHDTQAVPKVIDFGIAKATGERLTDRTLVTNIAQMIGTPLYMSPEQAEMNGLDVDTRSDVYALGVLLYELLTGTTPFDRARLRSAGYDEARRILREEEPPRPSRQMATLAAAVAATVSERRGVDARRYAGLLRGDLDWIVMKALEKDRARRYESASSLAADVERYLAGEAVEAGPPSAAYRLRKFAGRHKTALAAAGVVAATLVAATAVSMWQAVKARDALYQAEAERDRAKDAESRAKQSQADTQVFSDFLVGDVLAVARPEGVQGGLGVGVTVARALEAAEATLDKRFAGRPLAEAAARDAIGKTWRNLAKYEAAERQLRRAVELRERELGPDDPWTLDSRHSLGVLLTNAGRYAEATALHQEILERHKSTLGLDHHATLKSMNALATAYSEAGHNDRALPLFEETLKRQQRVFGPDDIDTLVTMMNLAGAYQEAGKSDLALPLLERTHEKMKASLGPDHTHTLTCMNDLAVLYKATGQLAKALPLFQQVLEKMKSKHGPDHIETLRSLNNLASGYQDAGQLAQALPLFEEAVVKMKAMLGPDNPGTLTCMNNLARAYWSDRQLDRSVPLFEEVLKKSQAALGSEHPDTLLRMANLGVNYRDAGRLPEGIALMAQAWDTARTRPGPPADSLAWIPNTLAETYFHAGQFAQAEPLMREVLAATRQRHGAASVEVANGLAPLGLILLKQKKYADAEPLLRENLAIREQKSADHWATFNAKGMLGASLLGQQKYAEAEPLLLGGYEGMTQRAKTIPPPGKVRLIEAIEGLVRLYEATGHRERAAEWRQKLAEAQPAKPAEATKD